MFLPDVNKNMDWNSRPLWIKVFIFLFACFVFDDELVVGLENNTVNVALFKSTSQSSQLDNSSLSDLAVDDDITTCSNTAKQRGSNWTVDLGEVLPVSHIKINTGGTYFGKNFELFVSTFLNHEGVLCNYGVDNPLPEYVVSCFTGPAMARTVTVKNIHSGSVMLCEVQVMVCVDGFFGLKCTNECHCDRGDMCDKINGKCPGLCAPGWNGTDCQSVCLEGRFGPSCNKACHCMNSTSCDLQTGECPSGCAKGWLDPACQTEIPVLANAPNMFRVEMTEIVIVFFSWLRFVHPSITLQYQIEYKLSSDVHGDQPWMKGPLVNDTDRFNEEVIVKGLRKNSFYVFRVIPILRLSAEEKIQGVASPESTPFRTKCSSPETPNITNAYSWTDLSRHTPVAVLSVEWMPLTKEQSNCENILYYEIFYQKQGSDWKNTGAKQSEHAKNISADVSFAAEYLVRVVAHNNHPFQSSSETKIVQTPSAPDTVTSKTPEHSIAIIAGIIVCIGLVLAIILAFIVYRQKKKLNYEKMRHINNGQDDGLLRNMIIYPENVYDELVNSHHVILPGNELPKRKTKRLPKRPPIKVVDLENYVLTKQENDCDELRKEYRDIPEINNEASTSIGTKIDNRHKNRFMNIIPYDHSRVIMKIKDEDINSDYINASYIDGYMKPKAYIASQGCTKLTTQDFWRMVWEEGCRRIVMVTNLVEKGMNKCEQYWPDKFNEPRQFHDISVVLTDEEKTADFVIRTLDVRLGEELRNVKQFHYTTWPDHGVPSRAGPIIAFRRKVRSFDDSYPGVIVVHCSAGVGRTGAFIALDCLLDQAKDEGQVDLFGLTCRMRKCRGNMIQTAEQYLFVYNALVEALNSGNTVISLVDFRAAYEALCRIDPASGKSGLQEQFEMLQSMAENAKPDVCLLGEQPENQDKNRFSAILPADKHRPYLMTKVSGTNDYINAVFLDGFRFRNAFILTQMPLPHTVIDLWRMIYEHKCRTIVMLNPQDDQDETYGQYWPEENEECECGPFVIELVSKTTPAPDIVLRKLKLSYNPESGSSLVRDPGPRMISHFQLTNWNSDESVPSSASSLVALIDLVEQSQKRAGNVTNVPTVVHCHDGVTQSGLYAVASFIWERLKDEQEVDVFQAVKHLRYFRRQIIKELAQYQLCYEVVLLYLDDFATYSNFR